MSLGRIVRSFAARRGKDCDCPPRRSGCAHKEQQRNAIGDPIMNGNGVLFAISVLIFGNGVKMAYAGKIVKVGALTARLAGVKAWDFVFGALRGHWTSFIRMM